MCSGFFVRALALVILTGISPYLSIAHNNNSNNSSAAATSSAAGNTIIVLDASSPIPAQARLINSARVTGGNSFGECTYTELLAKAKNMAVEANANVIKITERKANNRQNICDELNVTLYAAENVRAYEKEFSWSPERKLVWDDFRGGIPSGTRHDAAAATYCGIGFETNTVSSNKDKVQIYVYNTFYPSESWVKDDQHKDEILAHEQCHFDICELYTRKLRERMNEAHVTRDKLKTVLRSIYQDVQNDYRARQQQYEDETAHGIIPEAQMRWQEQIAKELAAMEEWSS